MSRGTQGIQTCAIIPCYLDLQDRNLCPHACSANTSYLLEQYLKPKVGFWFLVLTCLFLFCFLMGLYYVALAVKIHLLKRSCLCLHSARIEVLYDQ